MRSGAAGRAACWRFDEAPVPTLFFGLGARGKPAEKVADEAVDDALAYVDADRPVDVHSADQIVLPLALAEGASEYAVAAVSLHLTTNVAVIRRFLEREIIVEGELGAPGVVRIAAATV
jgi:RNA 3'-terminal phosphate cyclase (ATP)